jgi:hypothetical protein
VDHRLYDGVRDLKLPRTEADAFRALIWVAAVFITVIVVIVVVRALS